MAAHVRNKPVRRKAVALVDDKHRLFFNDAQEMNDPRDEFEVVYTKHVRALITHLLAEWKLSDEHVALIKKHVAYEEKYSNYDDAMDPHSQIRDLNGYGRLYSLVDPTKVIETNFVKSFKSGFHGGYNRSTFAIAQTSVGEDIYHEAGFHISFNDFGHNNNESEEDEEKNDLWFCSRLDKEKRRFALNRSSVLYFREFVLGKDPIVPLTEYQFLQLVYATAGVYVKGAMKGVAECVRLHLTIDSGMDYLGYHSRMITKEYLDRDDDYESFSGHFDDE